jgi:hypothetical protein
MGDKETPVHQEAAPAADEKAALTVDQEAEAAAHKDAAAVTDQDAAAASQDAAAADPDAAAKEAAVLRQALLSWLTVVFVTGLIVGVLFLVAKATWSRSLEIIPAAQKLPITSVVQGGAVTASEPAKTEDRTQWKVTGRVLDAGLPSVGTLVWGIAYDIGGNAYTPPAQRTNAAGEFTIDAIPEKLEGGDTIRDVRITAAVTSWPERWFSTPTVALVPLSRGSEAVKLSQLSTSWVLAIPFGCFLLTMLLFVAASLNLDVAWIAYYLGLAFSLLLTACMVWSIADAINTFNTSVPRGQVRTLGFLTIFEGTYIEGSGKEWLVSLTYPSSPLPTDPSSKPPTDPPSKPSTDRAPAATATVVHSLGAPFWVIFLAVLGAGLLTIVTVIGGVSDPPPFDPVDKAKYGERMRAILEQQFFVMFAPLSGIFIFQLLLLAGAAKEPVTVATIILGAGATLNALLARAAKSAEQYLQGGQTK